MNIDTDSYFYISVSQDKKFRNLYHGSLMKKATKESKTFDSWYNTGVYLHINAIINVLKSVNDNRPIIIVYSINFFL